MKLGFSIAVVGTLVGAMLLSAAPAVAAPAGTRYVAPGGSDAGDCTAAPCATIQYAVGKAAAGNTVSVAPGTYAEWVNITQRIRLIGDAATINADGYDEGIVISGPSASGTTVRGFTIKNAGLEGIFAVQTSHLVIAENELFGNDAYGPFDPLCVDQPDDCGEALHLQSVTHSTVSDNYVHDNVGGILLTDEDGPTSNNQIKGNRVINNTLDCGITLASHYFSFGGPAAPADGGIYGNHITDNTSDGNGAAGIGIFAGPPGAAAYDNVVTGNTAMDNGLPGVAIHSHFGWQHVEGNVITNNVLSGNGEDDDAGVAGTAGIMVFADANAMIDLGSGPMPLPADPIGHTVISANHISDEDIGIAAVHITRLSGLPSNKTDSSVTTPVSIN
jgi:parallel beta-helix repeat protein